MKVKFSKIRSSPNTMKNNAPNIGCGMVTKNEPNLLVTPNIIIINAELCITRRLPTYKYSFTNVTLPGINSHLDHNYTVQHSIIAPQRDTGIRSKWKYVQDRRCYSKYSHTYYICSLILPW